MQGLPLNMEWNGIIYLQFWNLSHGTANITSAKKQETGTLEKNWNKNDS